MQEASASCTKTSVQRGVIILLRPRPTICSADMVIFLPVSCRGAGGRILVGGDQERNDDAKMWLPLVHTGTNANVGLTRMVAHVAGQSLIEGRMRNGGWVL